MQRWVYAVLFSLFGGIGFAGGFYLAVALQKQIEVLVGAAIVLAVLTWIGSGANLVGLLREWYKDKREEEKLPSLLFDGYFKTDEPRLRGQVESVKISYYIRIINKNKKSEGLVEACAGNIGFRDSIYRTIWEDNRRRTHSFGRQASLKLFDVYNNQLRFTHAIGETGLDVTPDFPYANTLSENITLELESVRGQCPKPHNEKIEYIIKNARYF